jgi:hypothetical protein
VSKKQHILFATCAVGLLGSSLLWHFKSSEFAQKVERNLGDEALLALIKNDQPAFESFIAAGGDLHGNLPLIDGKVYTVSEGLSYFERPGFIRYLQTQKMKFIKQAPSKGYDILSLSIPKNNPELMELLLEENPNLKEGYGDKKWTLLHMASAQCSHKLAALLHEKGGLNWDTKAKDGSTPITLAAESDCLPMLSYWKENNADFKAKDGRGLSALSILKKKKDAALVAFAKSFEPARNTAAIVKKELNFYRKRKIPKHQIVDPAALIEPEDRPLEANETAEFSEFSD